MTSVSSVALPYRHADARDEANDQCLLVQDAIWRVVGEAARSQASLSLKNEAQKIASAFPESGFSRDDIKDALVFAAVDEGVVVDVGPPDRSYVPFIEIRSLIRAAGGRRTGKGGRAKKQPTGGEVPLQATA